jgi:hypothetical protein
MAIAATLLLACDEERTSDVPETPPEGFDGSCAAQLHSWEDVRANPDLVEDFLCIDSPAEGEAIQRGATLNLWASYPYTREVVIRLETTDSGGRRTEQNYSREYDAPAASQTFWLVRVDGAAIPVPGDTVPGDELQVVVSINNAETDEELVSADTTLQFGP